MKSSYITAIVIVIVAFIWILTGVVPGGGEAGGDRQINHAGSDKEAVVKVRVRLSEAVSVVNDVAVTGRSQASRSVALRAEVAGTVEEILFEEGAGVKSGDVLARIEARDRREKVEEAGALVRQREIELNAASKLETKGFNSKIRLSEARASVKAARTILRRAEIDLEKTGITAPFDGVLSTQSVETGDFVATGADMYEIVDLDPVEFVGYVAENHVSSIKEGQPAKVVMLGGDEVQGEVSFVSPASDPQTRTFRTIVSVANPELEIKEGLTAEIRIPLPEVRAHKISPSVLTLNDAGQVGVKIVEDGNRVAFLPVRIIADRADFMFVDGLPDKTRLISVGQEFVVPGQIVEPVAAEGNGLL